MSKAISQVPFAINEPVRSYEPGSDEVKSLISTYKKMWKEKIEIPMVIGGKEITTDEKVDINSPQDHQHTVGFYHKGTMKHVDDAINSALAAKEKWNKILNNCKALLNRLSSIHLAASLKQIISNCLATALWKNPGNMIKTLSSLPGNQLAAISVSLRACWMSAA